MGLLFAGFIARELIKRADTYRWKRIPCKVVSSSVAIESSAEKAYRFAVRYAYNVGSNAYTSERPAISEIRSANYSEASRLVEKYPANALTTCYVNPRNSNEAILRRSTLWFGLLLAFPLPFIAIGGAGLVASWRKPRPEPISSVSKTSTALRNQGCTALFCSVFLLAGLGIFGGIFVRPVVKIRAARRWQPLICTVISSEVRSHRGDDSTTYSVDILYSYAVNGKQYKANRYSFMTGSSSGYEGKAAVVARYRPGTKVTCYINPNDPTEAVLDRNVTADLWFGLIPLLFVVFGGVGLVYSIRQRGQANNVVPSSSHSRPGTSNGEVAGPVVLKARIGPLPKFLGALFVCVFWNGIVSVFLVHMIHGWQRGRGEWFLTLFLVPFVLIGLALVGVVTYTFVALFSPRVRLTVSASSVLPGASVQLGWQTKGPVHKVRRLRVYLEGREEATYTRGTRSTTDSAVFLTLPIAEITKVSSIVAGTAELNMPPDAIHSFNSQHNKIVWAIFAQTDVIHLPDVKDEFALEVLPQSVAPPLKL